MNIQKERFFEAFKTNNGRINEFDLGKQLGLDESEGQEILSQLLAEFKIKYDYHNACEYRVFKSK